MKTGPGFPRDAPIGDEHDYQYQKKNMQTTTQNMKILNGDSLCDPEYGRKNENAHHDSRINLICSPDIHLQRKAPHSQRLCYYVVVRRSTTFYDVL